MKAERARLGLSAKQVAETIGVHENAVLRWENDEAEPMGKSLVSLASLYGCTADYLLGMTDERKGHADFASEKRG